MNDTQRAAIAALPDDAPTTAVIAAWAGYEVDQDDVGWFAIRSEDYVSITGLRYDSEISWRMGSGERTLRRWLLDGGKDIRYYEEAAGQYCVYIGATMEQGAIADSPEAAWKAACEKFADALREDAKS